ncbi:S41 family peptidase [Butyrivibrio sp. AE3004]|uniref:S41 family peptidase n=1 Tax=Butyrivibrio sp. AE3004 TaxID=1506994 RepID=UPI000493DA79|nr:S41 family peptidase [Butyrivibrio sp. AE3004]
MKKKLLATILLLCMTTSMISGFGKAPESDKMEVKETQVYLMSAEKIPVKINLCFKDGGDVPYVSLDDWVEFYTMIMAGSDGDTVKLSIEKDGDKVTLNRDFGDNMVYPMDFDFKADTIHLMDYNVFFSEDKNTSLIPLMGMDEGYVKTAENSNEMAGDEITFDLSSYDIDMFRSEDKYYVPFQTLADIFTAEQPYALTYNGEGVFMCTGISFYGDDGLTELGKLYYSVPEGERSEEFGEYTYNELCFLMDNFYGLKDNHGIKSFDTLLNNNGFKEHMSGTDPKTADSLLYRMIHYIINDQHSVYIASSPYSGYELKEKLVKAYGQGPCREETSALATQLKDARSKYYPDGVPGYEEIGNTAYITFDGFEKPARNYPEEPATAEDTDTIGIISYSLSQILRKDSPVENVVLDLSQNLGGSAPAAAYVLSAFLGDANLSMRDSLTQASATYTYRADTNFDGKFDDKDTLAGKNLHLFCLTSKVSFSCGNLVPSIFKQTGNVALIGQHTGGGACSISPMATADGSFFRTSSNMKLSFMRNGSFYDVDQGVDPDYFIHDLSFLYDRKELTDYINTLK